MNNKEIIQNVIDAFDSNDVDGILDLLTDDVEWHMLGDQVISGKDELKEYFSKNAGMKLLSSTKDHIIIEGDRAAVDGNVQCAGKNGETMDMYYCDVYELEKGKVKKIVSYTVNKRKTTSNIKQYAN
jgi:ketosteroid isomerase-like protein